MGLFHLQFLKTIFDFGSRWQFRIWYLDIDDLHATNDLFFNINFRAQRQLETLFTDVSLPLSRSQSDFLAKKTLRCEKVELGELSPCSKPSKQWEFLDFGSGPPDLTDKKASYNGLDAVGPCMCLSVHVPNVYRKVVFTWLLTWKHLKTTRSISHGSEYCLCIGVDAYF